MPFDDDDKIFEKNISWRAVSDAVSENKNLQTEPDYNFSGKILCGVKYASQDLKNADFSGANLREADFSKADLQGANFTGTDLSGANLSNANLEGAVFSSALLRGTNFTGAKMNGVMLDGADIQDAILLDVEMDRIALDELQALVEYLAIFFPHKLNLSRINLALLDLSKIDLRGVNLRGVDFTGVDFTGVNIWELDLSECIISPEQIAQALGRPPTPKELKQILAPKNKTRQKSNGIDFSEFFDGRGPVGVWDLTKHPGISVSTLLSMGKQIYSAVIKKPELEDHEIMDKFRETRGQVSEKSLKERQEAAQKAIEARQNKNNEALPKEDKKIDITDYDYEQQLKREKENRIKEQREKYRETSQKIKETAREMYAYSRSRGQRERG